MDLIQFITELGIKVFPDTEYVMKKYPTGFAIWYNREQKIVGYLLHELGHIFHFLDNEDWLPSSFYSTLGENFNFQCSIFNQLSILKFSIDN